MAKTIEQLKAQGAEVKNATAVGENTATRVGTLFTDIVEHVEQYEAEQTEETKANADNIAKNAQAISDEVARAKAAEGAIVYDVSAHNDGAVFESLQALLSSSNLSTLIPTSVRHGGMTIRFIQGSEQSSDNNYVRYRLLSQTFTDNVACWQKETLSMDLDNMELLIKPVSITIPVVSGGKGYSNFSVIAGKSYKVKMTAKTGLANSYIFSGSGAPYTSLSLNNEITWVPENDGAVGIYDNLGRTGSVDIVISVDENIQKQIDRTNNIVKRYRNGSAGNLGNTYSVTTEVVRTNGAKFIIAKTTRPNTSGCHYVYGYTLTSSENAIGSLSVRDSIPDVVFTIDYSSPKSAQIVDTRSYPSAVGINITIAEVDSGGNYKTLSIADFEDYDIVIEKSNVVDEFIFSEYSVFYRNGSGGNPGNTSAVTTEVVRTNGVKYAKLNTNRPNRAGYHYVYGYTLTSSESAIGSLAGRDYLPGVVDSADYSDTSKQNFVDMRRFPTTIGINMTIAEVDDNGNFNPLRYGDFAKYTLNIELSNFIDNILEVNGIDSVVELPKCEDFNVLFEETTDEVEPFIFFSDPHFFATYDKPIMKKGSTVWLNRMKKCFDNTPTNFVLCGGDWLTEHKKSIALKALGQIDGMMNSLFPEKYYPVFGNHDNDYQGELDTTSSTSANDGALSNQQMVNLWFRKWGKMYYSFLGTATRFYAFDTGLDDNLDMTAYRWEQIDWFAGLLAQNDDEHNIVVMHIESVNSYITEFAKNITLLADAYNNKTSITLNGQTYNFSAATGKVHCALCGHTHTDAISTLNNIPVYCITTAMNDGTFDMVLINYGENELQSIRVGTGSNRTMTLA